MKSDTTPATKADLTALEAKLSMRIDTAVADMKRSFDVMVETMRHDFQDADRDGYQLLRDRQLDHERRLARLERHTLLGA